MEFYRTRDVKAPTRGTKRSAGIDFYVPKFFGAVILKPSHSIIIPSGIVARIPEGYCLIALNKSSIATKKSLITGAQVIDEDYTGEIHLHLINVGSSPAMVSPNEKIAQFVLTPTIYQDLVEVNSYEELTEGLETERGQNGLGSTNT